MTMSTPYGTNHPHEKGQNDPKEGLVEEDSVKQDKGWRFTTLIRAEFLYTDATWKVYQQHEELFKRMVGVDPSVCMETDEGRVLEQGAKDFPSSDQAYKDWFKPAISSTRKASKATVVMTVKSTKPFNTIKFSEQVISYLKQKGAQMHINASNMKVVTRLGWITHINIHVARRQQEEEVMKTKILEELTETEMEQLMERNGRDIAKLELVYRKKIGFREPTGLTTTAAFEVQVPREDAQIMEDVLIRLTQNHAMGPRLFVPYSAIQAYGRDYPKLLIANNVYLSRTRDITIIGCPRKLMYHSFEMDYPNGHTVNDTLEQHIIHLGQAEAVYETNGTLSKGKWVIATTEAHQVKTQEIVDKLSDHIGRNHESFDDRFRVEDKYLFPFRRTNAKWQNPELQSKYAALHAASAAAFSEMNPQEEGHHQLRYAPRRVPAGTSYSADNFPPLVPIPAHTKEKKPQETATTAPSTSAWTTQTPSTLSQSGKHDDDWQETIAKQVEETMKQQFEERLLEQKKEFQEQLNELKREINKERQTAETLMKKQLGAIIAESVTKNFETNQQIEQEQQQDQKDMKYEDLKTRHVDLDKKVGTITVQLSMLLQHLGFDDKIHNKRTVPTSVHTTARSPERKKHQQAQDESSEETTILGEMDVSLTDNNE